MTSHLKFFQADVLVGLAALDIVINLSPFNSAVEYELGRTVLLRLQGDVEKSFSRIKKHEGRIILQCIRLALRTHGNAEMAHQAQGVINKLERFVN